MPEIAFLMGKSSSGKDNIFKALVGDKELNLKTVIMYTTRPMRAGEKEGVEYYYVDNEKALELEAADKVIEMRTYNTVYGEWKYFTVDDGQILHKLYFFTNIVVYRYTSIKIYVIVLLA